MSGRVSETGVDLRLCQKKVFIDVTILFGKIGVDACIPSGVRPGRGEHGERIGIDLSIRRLFRDGGDFVAKGRKGQFILNVENCQRGLNTTGETKTILNF